MGRTSTTSRRRSGRPRDRQQDRQRNRPRQRLSAPTLSWPLATWLTPAVAMLVFGLMVFGTVAEPLGGRTVFVAVGTATLCIAAGIFMIVRAGPCGRGVGVALAAGGMLSGGLGVWTLLR